MMRSPIKWAGGKTRVMPQLLKHLPKADCLIEPFVGSGTVFLNTEYLRTDISASTKREARAIQPGDTVLIPVVSLDGDFADEDELPF